MSPQPKQFTEKYTKAEILAAYNELVARTQTVEEELRLPAPETNVSTRSADDSAKTITEVRTKILSDLHHLSQTIETLIEQKHEFEEEMKAKTSELERIHQIKIGAQTLQELRDQHRQEQFHWEQEKKERLVRLEHEEKLQQIKRQQDDAQYRFEREQSWKKEETRQLVKIQEREQELTQKERIFEKSSAELDELRAKMANNPKDIESAVKQAEQSLRHELTKQFDQEKKFLNQQLEHERKLAGQENTTFKQTIATQKVEIDQLTKQLTEATRQLNQIAIKVIEAGGSSKPIETSIIKPNEK